MKKLFVILALVITTSVYAQSIANLKIGFSKADVESVYSTTHVTKHTKDGQLWSYRINDEFNLTVLFDKHGLVSRIYATGDQDSEGVFESRKGIRLGDSSDKIQRLYGKGQIIRDCEAVMFVKYSNICFTCTSRDGNSVVTMIDVFPAQKSVVKSAPTKKKVRVSLPEQKIKTKFNEEGED